MVFQVAEHFTGSCRYSCESRVQRAQTSDQEPGIERLNPATHSHELTVKYFFYHLSAACQYSTQRIAVATDIFCCRLHTDIDAHCDGSLIQRGTIGIIHQCNQVASFGKSCNPFHILNSKTPRVWTFQIDKTAVRPRRFFKLFDFSSGDISGFHAESFENQIKHPAYPAVGVFYRNNMIARINICEHSDKNGCSTTVKNQAVFCL